MSNTLERNWQVYNGLGGVNSTSFSIHVMMWQAIPCFFFKTRLSFLFSLCKLSSGQTDSQVNASFQLVFNVRFVWPPTYVDLHRLATTCLDFARAQIRTQVDARFSPFGHTTQFRTQVLGLQTCVDLRVHLAGFTRLLASPFGGLYASTCESVWRASRIYLRVRLVGFTRLLASPFGGLYALVC